MVPSVPYLQAQWQLSLSGYLSEFYNIPQFWMWYIGGIYGDISELDQTFWDGFTVVVSYIQSLWAS